MAIKFRKGKKKVLKAALIIVLLIVAGLAGYSIYGTYRLNKLASMTFNDMLAYTTNGSKDAVITVGIIQNGKMTYDVYGENGSKLPREDHIYEIGSITKTFTTSLLCKAVIEGRVSLDDSIDKYLSLPDKDYYPTIERIVTHTSGYKNYYFEKPMITNFFKKYNDFNGITEEMLIKRIGKISLKDSEFSFTYSNFGISALGVVLERIYDEDYTKLINEYILNDLGLKNTRISDGSIKIKNGWKWTESDAYLPAGALLSDITDMLQYLEMNMTGKFDYLSFAHNTLAEVEATSGINGKMGIRIDAVGAGWIIDKENNITWHNGGTSNYNSYIGFNKEKQIGVVILSNLPPNYRIPATVMGIEILTSAQ